MSNVRDSGSYNPNGFEDEQAKSERSRILKILGVLAAVVLVAVLSIVFFVPKDVNGNTEEAEEKFEVSSSDKDALREDAENIVTTAGSFGVNPNILNGNIIHQVSYLASTESPGYKDYMTTRQDSYEQLKSFILPDSPIDYDSTTTSKWDTTTERDQLWNLRVNSAEASVPDEGSFANVGDNKVASVTVPVIYNSTERKYLVTAEDTSWDGSYRILEKNFNNNTADLVFEKQGNDWKLKEVKNSSNPVLLSLSGSVSDMDYENSQFDFEQVGTLKPDKKPGDK